MKQTAVEWLVDQFEKGIQYNPLEKDGYSNSRNKLIEQAKEMEKQQVINAHLTGLIHPLEMEATKQAEQYYNDNFGVQ